MIADGKYTNFTANPNTIQRYQNKIRKADEEKKREDEKVYTEVQSLDVPHNKNKPGKKKDLKIVFVISALIFFALIILLILCGRGE